MVCPHPLECGEGTPGCQAGGQAKREPAVPIPSHQNSQERWVAKVQQPRLELPVQTLNSNYTLDRPGKAIQEATFDQA